MNISSIAKLAINEITKNNRTLTPFEFLKTFCYEAKRLNVTVDDCEFVSKHKERLQEPFKSGISSYPIRDINDFTHFLVSNLNRLGANHLQERHFATIELMNKILKIHNFLDDNNIKDLSSKTAGLIERVHTFKELETMRNEWSHLIVDSKHSYKDQLRKYIVIEHDDDINTITENLTPLLEREKKCRNIDNIVTLLFHAIEPSLVDFHNKNYEDLKKQSEQIKKIIKKDHYQIFNPKVQYRINALINKRIELDKKQELDTVSDFNKIIDTVLTSIDKTAESSEVIQKNLDEVKQHINELKTSHLHEDNKSRILDLLSTKVDDLNNYKNNIFSTVKDYGNKLLNITKRINFLEKELKNSKAKANKDFLTKINNRNALKELSEELENSYTKTNENYLLILINLDDFKKVNETYGQDAGDLILVHFAKLLQTNARKTDIIGRQANEEFMVYMPNSNFIEAINFSEKFRVLIEKTRFIYKDIKIHITFSAGISQRQEAQDLQEVLAQAKKHLLFAKQEGKNRVYPNLHDEP
jgi:diguanylate cyclase (GGDEF)-like protein